MRSMVEGPLRARPERISRQMDSSATRKSRLQKVPPATASRSPPPENRGRKARPVPAPDPVFIPYEWRLIWRKRATIVARGREGQAMFSRNGSAPASRSIRGSQGLSFIGPEVVIGGDVTTTSQLHVDGRIDGHVRCGQLIQGGSGVITGDIVADEARIAGLVEGTVSAKTVVVEASGRIAGDVAYETISIAAGARIDGRLARREALAPDGDATAMLIATPTEPRRGKAAATTDLFPAGDKPQALVVD